MQNFRFAQRVVKGLDDNDLLRFVHFLEQREGCEDAERATDAGLMIGFANAELAVRRERRLNGERPVLE
jgi:hypothetical protein